jgi:hypothetical protein
MPFPAVGDPGTNTVAPPNDHGSKLLAALANGMDTNGNLVSAYIKLGTNPASAGSVRLANAGWVAGRNAGNSADINLIRSNSSDITEIGGRVAVGATVSPFDNNLPRLHLRSDWTGTETSANLNVLQLYSQAKGAWTTGHFLFSNETRIVDHASVNQRTVIGATNATPIVITTSVAHGYANGDRVIVDSVGGNTAANGAWIVAGQTPTTFQLTGSVGSGAYTTGGITTNRAGYATYLALIGPTVTRGGLIGANIHADDVCCYFGANNGTAKGTDFIYLGRTPGFTNWDTCGSFDGSSTHGFLLNNVGTGQVIRGTAYGSTVVPEYQLRMSRGTYEAPLRTKNGDVIARFSGLSSFAVDDVTASTLSGNPTARIDFIANEDQTVGGLSTRIVFYNTQLGTTTIAERARFAPGDGLDLNSGTFVNYQLRLKNNATVAGRNNAASGDINLFKINTSDSLEFLTGFTITDAKDVILATGTGTKIGTATGQKLAFHNSTPVIQHATTGETVGFTAGGGTTVTDSSTFTGNVGATAYRISDIVKALKNKGLMAA